MDYVADHPVGFHAKHQIGEAVLVDVAAGQRFGHVGAGAARENVAGGRYGQVQNLFAATLAASGINVGGDLGEAPRPIR